jgi:protein O-GlcNAc transferase
MESFRRNLVDKAAEALLEQRATEAVGFIAQVLRFDPEDAEALHVAGLIEGYRQNFALAAQILQRAVRAAPHKVSWLADLGVIQYAGQAWAESASSLSRAAQSSALSTANLRLLGAACLKAGRPQEAAGAYRQVLERTPKCAKSLCGLGRALRQLGELEDCIDTLEQCVAIDPTLVPAREELAEIYGTCGFHHLDLEQRRRIAALRPDDPDALMWLGRASFQAGQTTAAVEAMRKAIGAGVPAEVHSELLRMLLHDSSQQATLLREAHALWGAKFAAGRPNLDTYDRDRDPERRLRIGYVGGEFCSSPAFYFLMPLLQLRQRAQFEVTCYQTNRRVDTATIQYERASDRWRDASSATDEELCAQIRKDRIDILVDFSGHYEDHRLTVFAHRPAPVQATYPIYPCTTGVASIDYIFTDRWVCPEACGDQYIETPAYLRAGYLSYLPARRPPVTPLPAGDRGPVTFGIFQRPSKFNADFWDAVAQVLTKSHGSTLLIQYAAQELNCEDSAARKTICSALSQRGIPPRRIRFRGPAGQDEVLEAFAEADICLDTFPYNGQTTTCDCLWMGVPVVTLAGGYHVSRVGHSIVSRIGVLELSASDRQDYVSRAVRLADDRARLRELRRRLPGMMETSSLLNGEAVRALEGQYRRLWRLWCDSEL